MTKQEILEIIRANTPWRGTYYQEVNEEAIADAIIARQNERLKEFVEWIENEGFELFNHYDGIIYSEKIVLKRFLEETSDK